MPEKHGAGESGVSKAHVHSFASSLCWQSLIVLLVIVKRVNRLFFRRRGRAADATKRHSDTLMSSCLSSCGDAMRVTRMEARPSQTLMVRG